MNNRHTRFGRFLGLVSLLSILSACMMPPTVAGLPEAPQGIAPSLLVAESLDPYRLQVGDVLEIKLLLNPELNDQVTVRPDGMISTTIAQDVQAYGLTAKALQENLTQEYKKHLSDPNLTVIVRSFAPNRVYVTGEVNTPGEFITVGPNLTLLQAITRAGGVKNSAKTDEIVVIRRGATEKPEVYVANYDAAVTGGSPGSDVRLAPYDVVFVPRTGVANVYLSYQQYIQQFLPAGFSFSYSLNPDNN